MPPWRDCRCVIVLSQLSSSRLSSSRLSSSRCPPPAVLCGMSSLESSQRIAIYYKYSSILPMSSTSLAHLSLDSHNPQAQQIALNRLQHPLTKTNYRHTQWLSATRPHSFAKAISAHSLRTLRSAMPKLPHHAATHTLLALVTTGLVESRAMPSTSITGSLIGQLLDSARTRVCDRPPVGHSCLPLPHTAPSHASMSSPSASSRQLTIQTSAPIVSTSLATCLAVHVWRILRLAHSTKPSLLPWAFTSETPQHAAASDRLASRSSHEI